jgi:hypothetical protein
MLPFQSKTDAKLAAEIGDAVKAYDAADATRKEKAVIAGGLLVEARKRHPSKTAFEKFLELAGGVGIRRAEIFIAIALGRKEFEQHQSENAAAQQRHRDKLKAEKIEREKAKAALPEPEPAPKPKPTSAPPEAGSPGEPNALRNAATPEAISATVLKLFEAACRSYLPQLTEADLKKAHAFVMFDMWRSRSKKREAA